MTIILKKGTPNEEIDKLLNKNSGKEKKHNFEKYFGKIKFQGDPLEIQK